MKRIVNMHEAKSQLSKLIARAIRGEQIIIGKAGRPVAKLTAFDLEAKPRRPGYWRGKVKMAKDFDRLPPFLLKAFTNPAL